MTLNVTNFFLTQQSIKMHHWATEDYSLHVLLDDFYEDYSKLVDDVVENFFTTSDNNLEVLPFKPHEEAMLSLDKLLLLAMESFDEIKENIDKMPKGMRAIMDEVDTTMTKYRYLFNKFPKNLIA